MSTRKKVVLLSIILFIVVVLGFAMLFPLVKYDVYVFKNETDIGTSKLFIVGKNGENKAYLEFVPSKKNDFIVKNEKGEETKIDIDKIYAINIEVIVKSSKQTMDGFVTMNGQEKIFLERISTNLKAFEKDKYEFLRTNSFSFFYDANDKFASGFANPYIRLTIQGEGGIILTTDYTCEKIIAIPSYAVLKKLWG